MFSAAGLLSRTGRALGPFAMIAAAGLWLWLGHVERQRDVARLDAAELRISLEHQNAAIRQIASTCQQVQDDADRAAAAAVNAGENCPPPAAGASPQEYEAWLACLSGYRPPSP